MCPLLVQLHKYPSDGANGDPWSANVVLRAPVLADSTPWHVVTRWSSGQEFQVSSRRNDRPAVRVPSVIQEAALAVFRPLGAPYPSLIFRHFAHRPDMLPPPSLCLIYLHIDVTTCISELYGTSSRHLLSAYVFSFVLKYHTVLAIYLIISPHPEGKADLNFWV